MPRQHKSSAFCMIFKNRQALLALHNAVHKTDYKEENTEIIINTLEESLWTEKQNDLSYTLNGELVVIMEHQSTINENMPLRCLQIICRIYENLITDKKDIYKKSLIKLHRPRFIVFYNGKRPFAKFERLKLSDSFKHIAGYEEISLELVVEVYNINDNMNSDIVNACEELKGYVYFVSRVKFYTILLTRRLPIPFPFFRVGNIISALFGVIK